MPTAIPLDTNGYSCNYADTIPKLSYSSTCFSICSVDEHDQTKSSVSSSVPPSHLIKSDPAQPAPSIPTPNLSSEAIEVEFKLMHLDQLILQVTEIKEKVQEEAVLLERVVRRIQRRNKARVRYRRELCGNSSDCNESCFQEGCGDIINTRKSEKLLGKVTVWIERLAMLLEYATSEGDGKSKDISVAIIDQNIEELTNAMTHLLVIIERINKHYNRLLKGIGLAPHNLQNRSRDNSPQKNSGRLSMTSLMEEDAKSEKVSSLLQNMEENVSRLRRKRNKKKMKLKARHDKMTIQIESTNIETTNSDSSFLELVSDQMNILTTALAADGSESYWEDLGSSKDAQDKKSEINDENWNPDGEKLRRVSTSETRLFSS